MKPGFKERLLNYCEEILQDRIAVSQASIDNAQAAANEEEKSSAGDKYETSRAMSHIEKDMYARQLLANKTEMAALQTIDCKSRLKEITTGSFIECSNFKFFIAAGLGKVEFEGQTIFFISPNAPLAFVLFKRKKGEIFLFNKENIRILDIF
ncbi:MAG: hypothetical protein WKF35_07370 [Ferruginibacter sp.]